jgi:hypothetical protein
VTCRTNLARSGDVAVAGHAIRNALCERPMTGTTLIPATSGSGRCGRAGEEADALTEADGADELGGVVHHRAGPPVVMSEVCARPVGRLGGRGEGARVGDGEEVAEVLEIDVGRHGAPDARPVRGRRCTGAMTLGLGHLTPTRCLAAKRPGSFPGSEEPGPRQCERAGADSRAGAREDEELWLWT